MESSYYEKEKEKKRVSDDNDANIKSLQYRGAIIKDDKNDDENSVFHFTKNNQKYNEKNNIPKNDNYHLENEFEIYTDSKIEELKNEKERKEANLNLNLSRNSLRTVGQRKCSFDSVNSDTFHFGGDHTNTLGFSTGDLSVIREVRGSDRGSGSGSDRGSDSDSDSDRGSDRGSVV
jgi:hypothetical protein